MNMSGKKKFKRYLALTLVFTIILTMFSHINFSGNITNVKGDAGSELSESEPKYDEAKHSSKYQTDKIELSAQTSKDLGVTIPSDKPYYVTYTVKTEGDCFFNFRGDTGRVYIGQKQYCVIGVENEQWVQEAGLAKAEKGARITVFSSDEKVSVWLNGEKIIDNKALTAAGKAGQPQFSWVTDSTELTDIRVWMNKADDVQEPDEPDTKGDEPVYDKDKDKLWYDKATVEINPLSSKDFELKYKAEDVYYTSFRVKTDGEFYYNFRGSTGRIYIGPSQYCVVGVENEQWVQEKNLAKADKGAKVTVKSTGKKVSVWLNGKKVIDDANLVTTGECGIPNVSWTTEKTTLSDVKIWSDKSVELVKDSGTPGDEPGVVDKNEPVYEKAKHDLKYSKDTLNIGAEKSEGFGVTIAEGNIYYTSFVLKTKGDFFFNFRGDTGRLYIGQTQYCVIGVENETWVRAKGLAAEQKGVKVTICSAGDRASVWLNGVKVTDNAALNAKGELGLPKVSWTTENVTMTNMKIWTPKNQDDRVTVKNSDEPVYNAKKDYKYEISKVTNGTYKKGRLHIKPEKNSYIFSDLPYNASYYMTMKIKTSGAVNIQSRNKKDIVNMNADGFESVATGNKWVNKKFPTLENGARITFYSTNKKIVMWVDGEKIIDGKYVNSGNAQPGITWTFKNEVDVEDICIWTKEKYKSDEPVYEKKTSTLHNYKYNKGVNEKGQKTVKIKGKKAIITPSSIVDFLTDFNSDDDYYMSLTVQTEQSVNIRYRNPDGMICLSTSGYESVGTKGKWVDKTFYKLPTGMRVTFHSTPDRITIWADGEKIVDEPYLREGEAFPGIAWSFDKKVEVSNVKLWSIKQNIREDLGELIKANTMPLYMQSNYNVGLLPEVGESSYVDKQPIPRNAYTVSENVNINSDVDVIEADKATETKNPMIIAIIIVLCFVIAIAVIVILIVAFNRKNFQKKR